MNKKMFRILRNARFWIWWEGGWIKLTLTKRRPVVRLGVSRPADEGYYKEYRTYTLIAAGVHLQEMTEQKDCDGITERHWEGECVFEKLREPHDPYHWGDGEPDWDPEERAQFEETESCQRDHYAEMDGY